jgi:hypothetical protein
MPFSFLPVGPWFLTFLCRRINCSPRPASHFLPARVPAFQLVVEDNVNARSAHFLLFDPFYAVCNFFLVAILREEVVRSINTTAIQVTVLSFCNM